MRTSTRGLKFIAEFEGLRLEPYNDPAGNATVGVGHLIHYGPVTHHDKLVWTLHSREEALDLLRQDLKGRDLALSRMLTHGAQQRKFDAMSSLMFNIGEAAFRKSTVLREHNAGHGFRAGLAFTYWVFAGGRKFPGLVRRRYRERRLYRKGLYR